MQKYLQIIILIFNSVETQTTIGYGTRAITEHCDLGILIMSMQCIVGVVINAGMAGIIFSKFTIPANRAETIVFSKKCYCNHAKWLSFPFMSFS